MSNSAPSTFNSKRLSWGSDTIHIFSTSDIAVCNGSTLCTCAWHTDLKKKKNFRRFRVYSALIFLFIVATLSFVFGIHLFLVYSNKPVSFLFFSIGTFLLLVFFTLVLETCDR